MQRLAAERGERREQGRPGGCRQTPAAAVHRIAHQRMADVRQMHADLVGPTGLQLRADQGMCPEPPLDAVVGDRLASVAAYRHARALRAMTADGFIDGATASHDAVAERKVLAADLARRERAYQRGMGDWRARHEQQPGGVLVEAMHNAGARHGGEGRLEFEQRVLQRTSRDSGAWMHHESGRLVDHQQRGITVQDAKRQRGGAGLHAGDCGELRLDTQPLARPHGVAALRNGTVELHPTSVDPALQASPRVLRQQPCKHCVEPGSRQLRRYGEFVDFGRRGLGGLLAGRCHGVGYNALSPFRIPATMTPKPTPAFSPAAGLPAAARRLAAVCGLLLALALLLGGCASRRDDMDLARGGPALVYERARTALDNQDYENAIRIYEALVARFPFGAEARQARLDLIYAYYKGRESESALDQADTFIRENPTHPRIDYAWYVKGLVDFERSANFLERWLDVDLDARPPQTARRAVASFRKVVEEFPQSEYAHDARRRMIHLRNRLADYELYVARHYVDRGAWIAAARRAREVIEQFDGAPAVREALEVLILCYERLEMQELAAQTREIYAANYGGEADKVVPIRKPWWKFWG